MEPDLYIQARSNSNIDDTILIDGCPYVPHLSVDPDNLDTVKTVAAAIFGGHGANGLTVETVGGGITNRLYKVTGLDSLSDTLSSSPDACLVRVFGAEGMIDRDVENSVYAALAQQGLAPAYYGRFGNGRLEEWKNMRALEVKDMGPNGQAIAAALARMHGDFHVPEHLQQHFPSTDPGLWKDFDTWVDQARSATFQTPQDEARAAALPMTVEQLANELEWLKSSVVDLESPLAFCHNDLLAANIMIDDENLQLIDFEYGGINYTAFDIANHFNEYAGGPPTSPNPDYSLFPSKEAQRQFITVYLTTKNHGHEPSAVEVETMLEQVQGFVLLNHLYWGIWAFNQAAGEGCEEYDYMGYAEARMTKYLSDKEAWLSKT